MSILATDGADHVDCGCCDTGRMVRDLESVTFTHGVGSEAVELSVQVPVWSCDACGFGYEDEGADVIRHEAVCRHMGRLTPAEIKGLRKCRGMTQVEVAALTGHGIASIKRWEGGNQIQSASADLALRALGDRTRAVEAPSRPESSLPRFRTPMSPQSLHDATVFRLRPSVVGTSRMAA